MSLPQAFLRGFQGFPQGLVFHDGGKKGGHAGGNRIHGVAQFHAVAQAFQDIGLAHAFLKEVIAFLQRSERIFIRHFLRTEAADFLYGCPGAAHGFLNIRLQRMGRSLSRKGWAEMTAGEGRDTERKRKRR